MTELFNIPHLLSAYGYIGVFIIVFLESGIFFALPGDSLLFTAGLLAPALGFNLWSLVPLIFVATFLGGIVGYFIGVYLEKLHDYAFFRRILKREHIDKAHDFFERHGFSSILLSRFIPIVRTFLPIVAGIAKMNFTKFIGYSLISSILWSTTVTVVGYFLGIRFPWIGDYMEYIIVLVIVVSLIPVVLEWWRERRSQRNRTTV
jgi:membrane-associated protein